jgi:hypothetical protein
MTDFERQRRRSGFASLIAIFLSLFGLQAGSDEPQRLQDDGCGRRTRACGGDGVSGRRLARPGDRARGRDRAGARRRRSGTMARGLLLEQAG